MNSKDYKIFQSNVADFLKSNRVKKGCYGPKEYDLDLFYSKSSCECCRSYVAGNRDTYVFAVDGKPEDNFEAEICLNCMYYLSYGRLDDAQMEEINNETP